MASVALDPAYRRVEVREFLAMDFGGAKAELEDGLIYLMAGGTPLHALIAGNLIVALRTRLRGSGCRPFGSDLAVQTGERSIRFPDVSVYCFEMTRELEQSRTLGDPQVVVEVLSPSTSSHDQRTKLLEYMELAGVKEIVFVDPGTERVRVVRRTAPADWSDSWLAAGEDLPLPSLGLTVPHTEIFARD